LGSGGRGLNLKEKKMNDLCHDKKMILVSKGEGEEAYWCNKCGTLRVI
jgi:hypothetical protein